MSVSTSSTNLRAVARTESAAGSAAERALQVATRALEQAQQKLIEDVAQRADEKVIEADKMAVQTAAAAVARAAAALAREKQQHVDQAKAETQPQRGRSVEPGARSDAAEMTALISAAASIDVYA